jgi:cytochrome P450
VTLFIPPTIDPPAHPLGVMASLRAVRRNTLSVLPAITYTQEIVSGITGPGRWHMVQGPEGLKRVFLDNVENYPKSEVMIRMLRSAVGKSLFTSEGVVRWRWQRRAFAPVFASRNVRSLAPMITKTAAVNPLRIAGRLSLATLGRSCLLNETRNP